MKIAAPLVLLSALAWAQDTAEIASRETAATFSTRVNLVQVPVVVRDSKGKAIGNLTKEDFELYDKGKLQTISRFSIERSADKPPVDPTSSDSIQTAAGVESSTGSQVIPNRFVAYFFDDLHINFADLLQVQAATIKHLRETLRPTDRVAIYTSSGIGVLDFTDDLEKMIEAINRVGPKSHRLAAADCPPLTMYQADLIQNQHDQPTLNDAMAGAIACMNLINNTIGPGTSSAPTPPGGAPTGSAVGVAQSAALAAAARLLSQGEGDLQQTLKVLTDIVHRMSILPGQRGIVLLSPGFLITQDFRGAESDLLDRALRANVTLSAMDSTGLYGYGSGGGIDASGGQGNNNGPQSSATRISVAAALAVEGSLEELAEGTGGAYFHNNNDYNEGLRQTAATPEFIYLLGFSPQNLKHDGKFHNLKVMVKAKNVTFQARRGYYAPKQALDEVEQANQELREAIFSREEVQEFPIDFQTQFFKPTADTARLSVLTHVDLKALRFQKVEGRSHDTLTIVAGLFDHNGNVVKAIEKVVNMSFPDQNFQARIAAGVGQKISFDVSAGKYLLRVVVRDSEGQMMAARNGIVDIP